MHPALLIYFLLITCTPSTEKKASVEKVKQDRKGLFNLADSTKLIDSLYKNTVILKDTEVDSFICSHSYDTITKRIEIKCMAQVNKHKLGYILELTDTAGNYMKEDFYPSGEFRYDNSYIVLDDKKLPVTQLRYSNDSGSLISPVNVWYGNGFGPVAKYCMLPNKEEIFLVRGINFYCNGTNCSNYKMFVLQKYRDDKISIKCIDYPGNYPYNFENTFLFYLKGTSIPSLYFVKNGKTGVSTTDFEIISLR